MELFESHRKKFLRNMMVLFPVLFLVSVGLIFFLGLNLTSDETLAKEQQALEQALEQGAIDEEINAHSYIVPGLGDAGDLAYGEKE